MKLASPEDDTIARYKGLLASEYKDPYIQVITPPWPWWVPGLVLVAAVERAYLNEDPVHMDHWLITPRNHAFRSWEFPIAFAELDLTPVSAESALGAAKTAIFLENTSNTRGVTFLPQDSDTQALPPDLRARVHPPTVQETHGSYTVIQHAIRHHNPSWHLQDEEDSELVLFRVLVARGTSKILQETVEGVIPREDARRT